MLSRSTAAAILLLALSGPFVPTAAPAITLTFTDMRAQFALSPNPLTGGHQTLSLLVNETLFGPGGFAAGGVLIDDVGQTPPDDNLWLTDPFGTTPPDDTTPAISFNIDSAGEVSGISPEPFRRFVQRTDAAGVQSILGELDFSGVTGSLGSLTLAGVLVHEVDATGARVVDGTVYAVNAFTISEVPLPAALPLFATALGGLGLAGWRRWRRATAN